jgi:hypothetical protein
MYRTKWSIIICTSSAEAEFVVCVRGSKNACYLRSILQQMEIIQIGPTVIYVDNIAALMMCNAGKPTERSHHIDIQLVALLSWVKNGDMILAHIKVTDNPADALTKALGWVLHHHHCFQGLGLAGSPYTTTSGRLA